ncbi:phenylalanine 4-monooxygenase [Sphingomicrobium lutaoense]|uniref:Phenylalanine-4-hydroxylase n=1 Tax=Sphingomicrobium lutaoense TaxID=515949 RepID=A0A839Z5K7_9SPHN|nr:phenylalanine 4-monooxygenase [Sphingomicrobium lutaoense]MBB3764955.1 phenylalanine-4-hydroxylase [Sphingomicrobium lutaoense]
MFQPRIQAGDPPDWRAFVVPEQWGQFSAADHDTWNRLYSRQVELLDGRIVSPFMDGLRRLDLKPAAIPRLKTLSLRLKALTGWQLVSVEGIVPDAAFFAMLADRVFPIGNFIRDGAQLDYLEEPDCFHDIFGHVPLLAYQPMARLMEALGHLGVAACAAGQGETISRIYWHSVEFGLAAERGETRILGAGLASSFSEARAALEAEVPRPRFTVADAAATPYRNDCFQPLYFVADSLESVTARLEDLSASELLALGEAEAGRYGPANGEAQ